MGWTIATFPAKKERAAAWEAGREERLEASKAKAKADARACAERVARLCGPRSSHRPTVLPVHVWADVLTVLMKNDT